MYGIEITYNLLHEPLLPRYSDSASEIQLKNFMNYRKWMRYLISEEKIFPDLFQQDSLTDTFFTNYNPNPPR